MYIYIYIIHQACLLVPPHEAKLPHLRAPAGGHSLRACMYVCVYIYIYIVVYIYTHTYMIIINSRYC